MKITNDLGLPQAIVDAVINKAYTRGSADISITQLIKPPRMVALEELHREELTEDASDRVWALLGESMHMVLERANRKGIAERRLSMVVAGWTVSGGMDLYLEEGGVLTDYKLTSAWRFVDGIPEDYAPQLNGYAELLRVAGDSPRRLQVIAMLRDWSATIALRGGNYPQKNILSIPLPLWPQPEALAYLRSRVQLHQLARKVLPECTPKERWEKPTEYAVMKEGRKSALKLFDSAEEAARMASESDAYSVQLRPGASRRCAYCAVSSFCDQFKAMVQPVAATEPTAMSGVS